jgi:hypothetical protein
MSFGSVPSDGLPDLFQGSTLSSTSSSRPREFPAPMPDTGRSNGSSASRVSQLQSSRSEVGHRQARRLPATRPSHGLEDDSEFQPSGLRHWGIPVDVPPPSAWESAAHGDASLNRSRSERLPTLGRTIGAQGSVESVRDVPWLADGDDDTRDSRNTTFSIMSTRSRPGGRNSHGRLGVSRQHDGKILQLDPKLVARPQAGGESGIRTESSQFSPRTAALNEEWGWKWGDGQLVVEESSASGNAARLNVYSQHPSRSKGDSFSKGTSRGYCTSCDLRIQVIVQPTVFKPLFCWGRQRRLSSFCVLCRRSAQSFSSFGRITLQCRSAPRWQNSSKTTSLRYY